LGWPLKNVVNQDKGGKGRQGGLGIFPRTKNARLLNLQYLFISHNAIIIFKALEGKFGQLDFKGS